MDAAMTLLSAALDSSGYIVIVGLKDGRPPIQNFYAPGDYAGACANAMQLDGNGYNTYFATSTFQSNENRKAANANAVKVFKIDLDVSADTAGKYPSQKAAVAALAHFVTATNFPVPVLVSSGGGVHAYWIVADAMGPDEGKLYAEKFKAALTAHGMLCDPTVTADVARILRVPGTTNRKLEDHPKPVLLKSPIVLHDTDDMLDHIDRIHAAKSLPEPVLSSFTSALPDDDLIPGYTRPAHLAGVKMDAATQGLLHGKPKSFAVLLQRSTDGFGKDTKGCAQVKDIHDKQASTSEDRWRAGLSIARFCDDGEEAIHTISKHHNGYTHAATVAKAELILGPYTCQTFASNWPQECDGCPHKGKIKSPIVLADYVPRAEKGSMVVVDQNKRVDDAPVEYEIPEYPFPYFRGANGGVYLRDENDEDNGKVVWAHDLYAVDRLQCKDEGFMLQLRTHYPKDGIAEFVVNTSTVGSLEELRTELNKRGLLAYDKGVSALRSYLTRWFEVLEMQREASMVKTQFGWTDGFKSFVIGDREILPGQASRFSRPAPSLANAAAPFNKSGDLATWRRVFNMYATPGIESYAFCALVGFGSPLMAFTPVKGVLVNAFCQGSGTGKSTTLEAALSIWGNPAGMMLNFKDTAAARTHRTGIHQNIPVCVDEITKMDDDAISVFLLAATQGRGSHRMMSSSNSERVNNTTWSCITLSSANKSFAEKLQAGSVGVNGELMRLLEPQLTGQNMVSKAEADATFKLMHTNYGHAGDIYVKHLLKDLNYVQNMIATVQKDLDKRGTLTNQERVWSVTGACIIAGGILAKEAGLHDIDMDRIADYFLNLIELQRSRLLYANNAEFKNDLIGEWCSLNSQSILTVQLDEARGTCTVLKECSQQLRARYEKDSKTLYLLQSDFRKFLSERNQHLQGFLDEMKLKGVFLGEIQKRLAKGTNAPSPNSRVLVFKIDDEDTAGL